MEEVRKWSVRYTKHVKQKRKVYHEGFLQLIANNKVMLYDEFEKVLDSKFLNKDEAVKPGDSMLFSSFLVEIDDDTTFSNKKPKTSSTSTSTNNLSPSHHIIREFKKKQVIKYTTHHTPSNLTASSLNEWEALYTTQITQKAKKYHDGFIQLIICGSQARQVALYDSSKTQIDKRFLKKDEVISSGGSLKFDGHLVDIGDALGNTMNDAGVKNEASNYNSDQIKCGQKWHKLSNENLVYNTQRSEKPTKRTHLRTGNAVEIESRSNAGSNMCHGSSFGGTRIDKMNPTKTPHSVMPPRDVHHILSILKKPAAQDNVSIPEKAAVKQCFSESSDIVQFVVDGKPYEGIAQFDRHQTTKATNEHDCDEVANRGSTQTCSTGDHRQRKTYDNIATAQPTTDCSSNDIESPVFIEGSAFESPNKSEPSVGTAPRQSIIHHPIHSGFMGSISSGSQDTRSTHQQPCDKLPMTDASSVERTSSTSNKPKARRPFSELNGMKIKRNDLNADFLLGTLDCPSFDLGI
ncbi:hypothetical protein RND81_08G104700 [Saponaria officinalis]|uniref:5'-3' DNA helicase ZGRF1-like N-terminal domain-containing protein n=1 Tax=Saponaria officinalis TaxID=3572 RepID=A0AAW1J5S8_SAPOF